MTATAKIIRSVLSNEALNQSVASQAKEIVARAEKSVETYMAEISSRSVRVIVEGGGKKQLEKRTG